MLRQTKTNIIGILEKSAEVLSPSKNFEDMNLIAEIKVFLKYSNEENILKLAVKRLLPEISERMQKDILQSELTDAEIIICDIESVMKEYSAFPEYVDLLFPAYADLDGNPVKKTPWSSPYNYDSFAQWKSPDYKKEGSLCEYSDRLMRRNWDKFNKCCKEVWGNMGQYFDNRTPEEINKFLDMYLEHPVKLTAVVQCCNQSSGFPYWCFIFENVTVEEYVKNHNVSHIISEEDGEWTGFGEIPWYFLNHDIKRVEIINNKYTVYV